MHVLTEINWAQKAGGARRVTSNILEEMMRISPKHFYSVATNANCPDLNEKHIPYTTLKRPRMLPKILWDQFIYPHLALPQHIKKTRPDLVHFTNALHASNVPPRAKTIVTIHDMIPFVMSKSFHRLHIPYLKTYIRYAVNRADHVITVSEHSKQDIINITKTAPERITVIYNASNLNRHLPLQPKKTSFYDQKYLLQKPFFLFVGAIHPRKNVERLIESFSLCKKQNRLPHKLILAGSLRWGNATLLKNETLKTYNNDIVFTGKISDEELIYLYQNCEALTYPSLYEGFGLPVIEAMSLNAPVITSKTSCLPEIAGESALLVNPKEISEIAEAMCKISSDRSLREQLVEKGKLRAKFFSWEKAARQTLTVYQECFS